MRINKRGFWIPFLLPFALLISPSLVFGSDHRGWVMDEANCVLSRSSDTTMIFLQYNRYDTSPSPHPSWLLALGIGKSYDARSLIQKLPNMRYLPYKRFAGVTNLESQFKDPIVVLFDIVQLEDGIMIMLMQRQTLIQLFDSVVLTLYSPELPSLYAWTLHGISDYRDRFLACEQ